MSDQPQTPAQTPPAAALNGTAPAPEQPPAPPEQPASGPQNALRDHAVLEDIDTRLTTVEIGLALLAGLLLLAIAGEVIAYHHRGAP